MSIDSARASARGMGKDKRTREKVVINNTLTPTIPISIAAQERAGSGPSTL
jgi:hypothetical protein